PHLPTSEASDKGRIRNKITGTIRKPLICRKYYKRLSILGRSHLVHRLVMAAHLGRELTSDEYVRHLDDDGLNNKLSNLAIGSAADNLADRRANDRAGFKLRKRDVQRIRAELASRPAKLVAITHNISHAHACNIRSGARYGWLH
ncbi:MAG: HNH endonuclease, partial [Acidocella sp.]|nr:HNH endonuclease [Acidocella sp.]